MSLPLPLMGWSTWTTFKCHIINDTLVRESISALAHSPLRTAGYDWITIGFLFVDDCWTTCLEFRDDRSCGKG